MLSSSSFDDDEWKSSFLGEIRVESTRGCPKKGRERIKDLSDAIVIGKTNGQRIVFVCT
jgi:hypothetical protein